MSQEDRKDGAQLPAADTTSAPEVQPVPAEQGTPESEVEQLLRQVKEAQDEARANHDHFLRERAELENFKKRMQREKADAVRFANEPLIRDLLPVVDNLERALAHGGGDGQVVVDGVRLVLKSLLDVLKKHGVERVEAVGRQFDPSHHEAMAQVESPEHEPNQVVEQHHTGYLLHGRLLRPALVTVSRPKSNGAVETEPNSD